MPVELVNELTKVNSLANKNIKQTNMTVFFSDIRGFTSIIEKNESEELFDQLNEYFEIFDSTIKKYGGILDKYIGDSVMGFWGEPKSKKDHPINAAYCILEIKEKLKKANAKWTKAGKVELITNFGINTGEMFVGNIGSYERLQYTLLGDNVNVASRLESLNKRLGTEVLVSESTYKEIKDYFNLKKIDKVKLIGRESETTIYELVSFKHPSYLNI